MGRGHPGFQRHSGQSRVRPGLVLQAQREGAQRVHGRGHHPLLHQRYLDGPRPPPSLGVRATVGAARAPGGGPGRPGASLSLLPRGPTLPPGLGTLGSHVEIWGFIVSIQWTPCRVWGTIRLVQHNPPGACL